MVYKLAKDITVESQITFKKNINNERPFKFVNFC